MSRVSIQPQAVPAASQPLLDQIQQAFGATPNMFKAWGSRCSRSR